MNEKGKGKWLLNAQRLTNKTKKEKRNKKVKYNFCAHHNEDRLIKKRNRDKNHAINNCITYTN